MVSRRLHKGLASYLAERIAESGVQHSDGSVHLTFDMEFRVSFTPTSGNALLLESKIIDLSSGSQDRTSSMQMLLENIGYQLDQQTAAIVVPQNENSLVLQQLMPESALGPDFEKILENFINVLAGLRSAAGPLSFMGSR